MDIKKIGIVGFSLGLGLGAVLLFQNFTTSNNKPILLKSPFTIQASNLVDLFLDINANNNGDKPHTEIPPFVIAGGWTSLFISTGQSYQCSFAINPLLGNGTLTFPFSSASNQCFKITQPEHQVIDGPQIYNSKQQWKRNYAGTFGGFINDSSLWTIHHGENKNEYIPGVGHIRNSINDDFDPNCWSGFISGKWIDCPDSYNAFIYMQKRGWSSNSGYGNILQKETSPIIWPSLGYLTLSEKGILRKSSQGVRHPSIFREGEWLYVFYQDTLPLITDNISKKFTNLFTDPSRRPGFKVARAPISSLGSDQNFKVLFNGTFSEPALPLSSNFRDSLKMIGPRGDLLLPEALNVQKFNVSKLIGTQWYMAVVTYNNWSEQPKMGLSFSKNLTNWTSVQEIFRGENNERFGMHYALPMSLDGTSNTLINPNGFYIIGVSVTGIMTRSKITLK